MLNILYKLHEELKKLEPETVLSANSLATMVSKIVTDEETKQRKDFVKKMKSLRH